MDLPARAATTAQLCVTLASHADLTLLLDLDGTLIPFAARTEDANLDIGAVRVLGALHDAGVHAVITNPYHPEGLADDIDLALRMSPTERRERHGKLMAALAGKTPQGWATAFLARLLSTARSVA
jgi:hypothetical protein